MFVNPHVPKAGSYKAQLHCHSNVSDGDRTPAQVAAIYQALGFSILSITDHDYYVSAPSTDPGGHSMLFLRGIEETGRFVAPYNGRAPHIAVNGTTLRYPDYQDDAAIKEGLVQNILTYQDASGAFITLAHPSHGGNAYPDSYVQTLEDFYAMEIFNALGITNGYPAYASDLTTAPALYEVALNAGKHVWCTAVDDAHWYGQTPANQGQAYCVVSADTLSQAAVIAELKAGNFYATTGPTLSVTGNGYTFTATTNASSTIEWRGSSGSLRTVTGATSDTYTPPTSEAWVRVVVTHDTSDHPILPRVAFSQPLWWSDVPPAPQPPFGYDGSVIVSAPIGARTSAQMTVNSPGGNLVIRGANAARFDLSTNDTPGSQSVTVAAGEQTVYIGVTPEAGDGPLTATLGVPR